MIEKLSMNEANASSPPSYANVVICAGIRKLSKTIGYLLLMRSVARLDISFVVNMLTMSTTCECN